MMRKRTLTPGNICLDTVDIPDNYHKIVVTQKKSRITIRNLTAGAGSSIESKQTLLMHRLHDFFRDPAMFAQLVPLLEQSTKISLRLLDWVVTNYSKKNNLYLTVERDGTHEVINLFLDYKAHLKSFSKRSFDPFCRRERVIVTFPVDAEKRRFLTTPAQLNFYKWTIQTGVLNFCEENLEMLEKDMIANLRVRTEGSRRAEISPCATAVLNRATVSRTIEFS